MFKRYSQKLAVQNPLKTNGFGVICHAIGLRKVLEANPSARVEVQLFIDDTFAGDSTANQYRPDVHQAKRAPDDWHGFAFSTPQLSAGDHQARVYAVHANGAGTRRTLQLIGKPYRFRIGQQ